MPLLGTPALTLAINAGTTTNGNSLVTSPTDNTVLSAACEVQGAKKFLNLYFQLPGTGTGSPPINQQLPPGFALTVNGKPADDLQATTVLFTASGFAQCQDATNAYYYQAFLNLDTEEIATAFAGGDADLLEALVDIDLDLPAAGSVPALQATFQIALNLIRQVYAGTESVPTPATPTYPPGPQVTALVAAYLAGTLTSPAVQAASGPAVTPALASAGNLLVNVAVLTAATTINAPTGDPLDGQEITFRFVQDSAGGHPLTWAAVYAFPVADSAASLPTGAGNRYEVTFGYDATDSAWRARGVAGPY